MTTRRTVDPLSLIHIPGGVQANLVRALDGDSDQFPFLISNTQMVFDGSGGFWLADDGMTWDDLRFPFFGQQLDSSAGRIDYNYAENSIDYAANARYDEEKVCFTPEMPHKWYEESAIHPHLHWLQEEDEDPNWLLRTRILKSGIAPGAWSLSIPSTQRVHSYSSGTLTQMTLWPSIDMTGYLIETIVDFQVFRDTANTSGLFSGSDNYSAAAKAKIFDVHYLIDSFGSQDIFVK